MQKYIQNNLKYPVKAQEAGVQGRVALRFIVSATGEIEDVGVMRGISPECDAEAVRVIKAMPKWNPGKQNGKDVAVYFNLPIQFKLQGESKEEPEKPRLYAYEGKLYTDRELNKEIPTKKDGRTMSIKTLEEAEATRKYGEAAKGKVIVEFTMQE